MAPIVTREQLVQLVSADRAAEKTVALANGCFDLLHVGHVRYLTAAAAEADRLIVAVNDDESVTTLKGVGRPVLPAADRAELVAAFGMVDYVVLFSDRTVADLLKLVQPDVHCKGTDYTVESVPRARDRARVRWPDEDRRRSKDPFDTRSLGSHRQQQSTVG